MSSYLITYTYREIYQEWDAGFGDPASFRYVDKQEIVSKENIEKTVDTYLKYKKQYSNIKIFELNDVSHDYISNIKLPFTY